MSLDQMIIELGGGEEDHKNELIAAKKTKQQEQTVAQMEGFCDLYNLTHLDLLRIPPATLIRHFSKYVNAPIKSGALRPSVVAYLKELYPDPTL